MNAETFPAACCGVFQVRLGRRPASLVPTGVCKLPVDSPGVAWGSSAGERAAFKLPDPTAPAVIDQRKGLPRLLGLLALLACALTAEAQPVVAPPPPEDSPIPAMAAAGLPAITPPVAAGPSLFQWGPVNLHPHFSYRFLYGDGIQARPGQQSTTAIQTISPGMLLNLGSRWTLDYTPTQTYYSDPAFRDSLDHSVNLAGGAAYDDLTLQFSQSYVTSSSALIETGRQTNQKNYATVLNGTYRLGRQTLLDTTLNQSTRLSDSAPNSREWTAAERLHYQFSTRLDTAISVDLGYVDMSSGSDMTYTRPQAQITWRPTDKLFLNLQGGVENRKFRTGGAAALNNPILSASCQYQPFESTTLTLAVTRSVTASYFADQVTENSGWSANWGQRLFGRFQLTTSFSQQNTNYVATSSSVTAGRADRNYSFSTRLGTALFQHGTIAVLYQNSHNSSNNSAFGFSSSQVGVEFGYRY